MPLGHEFVSAAAEPVSSDSATGLSPLETAALPDIIPKEIKPLTFGSLAANLASNRMIQLVAAIGIAALASKVWSTFTMQIEESKEEKPRALIKREPDAIRKEKSTAGIQTSEDGEGPYYHRKYSLKIRNSEINSVSLIDRIREDINSCSPQLIARFEKTKFSDAATFEVGDEFQIHISGPWNGPVRVSESTEDSFTFVTKEGHFEAGGIAFRARDLKAKSHTKGSRKFSRHDLLFEIESWSRSSDGIVDLVYDKIPAARVAQTQMWAKFCESAAELSGGEALGDVQVKTEKAKA